MRPIGGKSSAVALDSQRDRQRDKHDCEYDHQVEESLGAQSGRARAIDSRSSRPDMSIKGDHGGNNGEANRGDDRSRQRSSKSLCVKRPKGQQQQGRNAKDDDKRNGINGDTVPVRYVHRSRRNGGDKN